MSARQVRYEVILTIAEGQVAPTPADVLAALEVGTEDAPLDTNFQHLEAIHVDWPEPAW